MRSGFPITLFIACLFSGIYFYSFAQAVCPTPLPYRVGQLDEEFGLTLTEAETAIIEAAQVWEEATGKNLFVYDSKAEFTINFVFDERQALLEEEKRIKNKLSTAENINDVIIGTHSKLVSDYESLKLSYTTKVSEYENRLETYEQTVSEYNENGGAPADKYEALEVERKKLNQKQIELKNSSTQLSGMASEINELGDKGNALVNNYNQNVGSFNERFGESHEFTQGDYIGDRINIYTYNDIPELKTVLAHELGHSLSLDHVDDEVSVMFYLMGAQPDDLLLSENDVAEYVRVCEDMNIWDKIVSRLSTN